MPEIPMPRLSDSMEEGTVLEWLKGDGEPVARGEGLVEIETDKATMVHEADFDGTLRILVAAGETVAVGAPIASYEPLDGARMATMRREDGGATAAEDGPVVAMDGPAAADDGPTATSAPVSPVARRLARKAGIDLVGIAGSGPGGRIVKADVEALIAGAGPSSGGADTSEAEAPPADPAPAPRGNKGEVTTVEPSRAQAVTARRMAESKGTAPDFAVAAEVDMEAARELRAALEEAAGEGPVPSFNDMVVKALALALRRHPRANGAYRDGRFELYARVNVGVAVAAAEALVVPTVFDADTRSLGSIAVQTRALAERVRAQEIGAPELSGGTFTVSNLGMYGVTSFTAVLNPPQAGILAVGAIEPRAVVRDGAVVGRHTMTLTLTCDHRILYGADAARLLASVRELLERPTALTAPTREDLR